MKQLEKKVYCIVGRNRELFAIYTSKKEAEKHVTHLNLSLDNNYGGMTLITDAQGSVVGAIEIENLR